MKVLKNSKGFTLAEMLIVMAVVVVLAAAAIPVIEGQTEAAKQTNDLSALRDAYVQAYTEAAMIKAGGGNPASVGTTPIEIDFQQDDGDFGKLGNLTIGGATVTPTGNFKGDNVSVTFAFDKDLALTSVSAGASTGSSTQQNQEQGEGEGEGEGGGT